MPFSAKSTGQQRRFNFWHIINSGVCMYTRECTCMYIHIWILSLKRLSFTLSWVLSVKKCCWQRHFWKPNIYNTKKKKKSVIHSTTPHLCINFFMSSVLCVKLSHSDAYMDTATLQATTHVLNWNLLIIECMWFLWIIYGLICGIQKQ